MSPSRALLWLNILSAASAGFVTGQLGDASENLNNPMGAAYYAALPASAGVEGSILASTDEGQGTNFAVNFANLPNEGGPFLYHIHAYPVPSDGDCNGTQAHLDPYIRGETPACDPSMPATCQVGDLSGKYGTINGTSGSLSYHDPYVSLQPGLGAFFGNRSFVLHFANTTRIACANFLYIGEGMIGNPNSPSNGNGTVVINGTTIVSGPSSTVSEFATSTTGSSITTTTSTSTSTSTGAAKTTSSSSKTTSTGTAAPAMVTASGAERWSPYWSSLLLGLLVFAL